MEGERIDELPRRHVLLRLPDLPEGRLESQTFVGHRHAALQQQRDGFDLDLFELIEQRMVVGIVFHPGADLGPLLLRGGLLLTSEVEAFLSGRIGAHHASAHHEGAPGGVADAIEDVLLRGQCLGQLALAGSGPEPGCLPLGLEDPLVGSGEVGLVVGPEVGTLGGSLRGEQGGARLVETPHHRDRSATLGLHALLEGRHLELEGREAVGQLLGPRGGHLLHRVGVLDGVEEDGDGSLVDALELDDAGVDGVELFLERGHLEGGGTPAVLGTGG